MYDFKNVVTFEPVEEGSYDVICVKAKKGLTKSTMKDKIDVEWKILAPKASAGKKLFDVFPLQDNALWKTKHVLEAAESPLVEGRVNGIEPLLREFKDMIVTANATIVDYKGKKSNNIDSYSICVLKNHYKASASPAPEVEDEDLPF